MSLRTIWRELKCSLICWEKIEENNIPKWVIKKKEQWEDKLSHRPYDLTRLFVGKHYIYKIYFETIAQGEIYEHYYRKKRVR